ncbi:hypothetical protein L6252_02440 [Candidatus Parcubacteria bacterium]|nr:hypothetical protein [Candidatus Parcubacteria bacterium]
MILIFILQILLTVSLGGMVFILAHKMPLLSNIESLSASSPKKEKKLNKTKNLFRRKAALLKPSLKEAKRRTLRIVNWRNEKQKPEDKLEQIEQNRDYWDKISE